MTKCPKCLRVFQGQTLGWHSPKCNLTMADLFWVKVNKDAPGGCWLWMASTKETGYGQFFHKGKMHRAHRLAWNLSGRELPAKGLELAHSCDNRLCVNPDHLYVATHGENMADCYAKDRHARGMRAGRRKLDEEAVRVIRAEYVKGNRWRRANTKELAARFGVKDGAVQAIIRGDAWTSVK